MGLLRSAYSKAQLTVQSTNVINYCCKLSKFTERIDSPACTRLIAGIVCVRVVRAKYRHELANTNRQAGGEQSTEPVIECAREEQQGPIILIVRELRAQRIVRDVAVRQEEKESV